VSQEKPYRGSSIRIALLLLSAVAIFITLNSVYSGLNTINRLEVVEAERDRWQRPSDVLGALDLREGNVVVDLGSGAGYFALKLSTIVGTTGQVLAVDLRRLSLFFLWIRAAVRSPHNIRIIVGDEDNPHLPGGTADAVLIANTYHEFRNPRLMLDHTMRSLRPGGRLVIADRGPRDLNPESEENHEIPLVDVEDAAGRIGFEIIRREDRFIDRPRDDPWWLLVARKP
jgi:ubiquinone/menaquinone biosynthesis C-methylase UbiE